MDSERFRETYNEITERFCPFEKGILTNQCDCTRARRFCIAEREGVECDSNAAQQRCVGLMAQLRTQARFALRTAKVEGALPFGKVMRVQVGGLRGLHAAVFPEEPVPEAIGDINGLIEAAIATFGDLKRLPFQPVVQQITAYRGRQSRSERRKRR